MQRLIHTVIHGAIDGLTRGRIVATLGATSLIGAGVVFAIPAPGGSQFCYGCVSGLNQLVPACAFTVCARGDGCAVSGIDSDGDGNFDTAFATCLPQ